MTQITRTFTRQQLDDIEAVADAASEIGAGIEVKTVRPLLAEVRRLRDHVAELETYALGCDAEGCTIPHSSWCERAKTAAAENDGCTCPQPWKDSPQPHAGYCWLLSPPRDEIERARKRIAELAPEVAKLARWHREDETALREMRGTIEQLRAEKQELGGLTARRESELIATRAELATANARLNATARQAGRQETKLRELGAPTTVDIATVTCTPDQPTA